MTALVLITLNIVLIIFFTWLLQRPGLLGYAKGGKWLATWLTVGVITLMDELTSVFYAPAEAHRFIGQQAIFFTRLRRSSCALFRVAWWRSGKFWSATRCAAAVSTRSHTLYSGPPRHSWRWPRAGLVASWRDIARAYWFLALTVGVVTPVVSALALSAPIDFRAHEGDLIPHWATTVANVPFGVVVGLLGSVILIMAVNTAYVASSELLERVAHRYRFEWLAATNRRASLYRIHLLNASVYTGIILLTRGSQAILAEMYAIGLLASFSINIGCLLIYRYFHGTKEIRAYYTSRTGTLVLEALLLACFVYLALHKPYGTALWASVVAVILAVGLPLSRRYGPERAHVRRSDFPMELILSLAETDRPRHLFFRRPGELETTSPDEGTAFITFFSPRQGIPPKVAPNHFRFPIQPGGVYGSMTAVLALVQEEFDGQDVHVHLGWPLSSWLDRMAMGVFVANLLRLPKMFEKLKFSIEYRSGTRLHYDEAPTRPDGG